MHLRTLLPALVSTFLLASLVGPSAESAPRRQLRVALFPYLPAPLGDSNESLRAFVEQEFERQHPDIDLHVRPIASSDEGFYSSTAIKGWLAGAEQPGAHYDVVELDTVLLGELEGHIASWDMPVSSDWLPAAAAAAQSGGKVYAIPHWLCAYYIISRSPGVGGAKTLAALVTELAQLNTQVPDLVGNFKGSWTMPTLYLDAYHDTFPTKALVDALSVELDSPVLQSFKQFARLCRDDVKKTNPCLDGTYKADSKAADLFAGGNADALLGYSERLHYVATGEEKKDKELTVNLAPLGAGSTALFFVDAFVARKDLTAAEKADAATFVRFMNAPSTYEAIMMSLDAYVGAKPRYLLAATKSAYQTQRVRDDVLYRQLAATVQSGDIYPQKGLEKAREDMRDAINAALAAPSP